MLAVAVQKQKILHNVCDRVDPPRVPKREMTFLNWDQSVRLAEAHSERFRPMIYVAVDSGMRWGELVGLRRANVDVSRHKIRVTEQLVQLTDRSFVRRPPKTAAGRRSITISPFTADILSEHLERSANPGPDGLVFPNAAGNPLSASSFQTHHFGRLSNSQASPAAFTTCGTRASHWPSPPAPTRRRYKRAWAMRRST